jgi:hypothetical protein
LQSIILLALEQQMQPLVEVIPTVRVEDNFKGHRLEEGRFEAWEGWSEAEPFSYHGGMQERFGRLARPATMPSGQACNKYYRVWAKNAVTYLCRADFELGFASLG